jgi:hypothetical protein
MRTITASPTAFISRLFVQNVRDAELGGPDGARARRIAAVYYSKALVAINEDLRDADTVCSDSTLLSVLALAYYQPRNYSERSVTHPARPKQGPMDSLRLLNIHRGPIGKVSVHAEALGRLVAMRGGLHDLTLPGLGSMMS